MINMARSTKKKLVFTSIILTDDKCKNNEHLTIQLKKSLKNYVKISVSFVKNISNNNDF